MQADFADRVIFPEVKVVAAGGEARGSFGGVVVWVLAQMLQHQQGSCMCLAVPCYSIAQKLSFIDPCRNASRQVDCFYGGFSFVHSLDFLSRKAQRTVCMHFMSMYQVKKRAGGGCGRSARLQTTHPPPSGPLTPAVVRVR